MRHRIALAILTIVVLVASAFAGTARTQTEPLTIYAAASLTDVFRAFDPAQRYSFAGSNTLETQIRNGAPADIFASAAPLNTQRLFGQGLVDKPVTFTSNRLALIVPKSNPAELKSVYDLKRKPVKLVICGAAVPVGAYTRTVLRKMGLTSVLSKVVSQETDVRAVTGKVALGQADAGFVYVTDARSVSDQVTVIRIPAWAQPRVRYEIAVVSKSTKKAVAQAWIKTLLSPKGQAALKAYGFLPLPKAASPRRPFPGDARSGHERRPPLPAPSHRRRLPPRAPERARLGARLGCGKDALRVTAETITISMLAIILFGTPAAYWISTRQGAFRDALVTLVELPLVLPPAVAGIGLLVAFGRVGLLGGTFDALGIDIAFTKIAVVLAVTFVASPFYLRTAIASFEVVDPTLPAAARTLGARPGRVFMRVMLPLARGGLGAGAALAFARGLGEFGATIMFAGSLQGVTQTLSLAIYEQFDIDFDVALAISALLIVLSAAILLSVKLVTRWRSGSASLTLFAASARRPT